MPIRAATLDDVDEICALVRELADYEQMADEVVAGRDQMAEHLFGRTPAASVLIAEDETQSEIAGFALFFPTFSTFLGRPGLWLEDLFVRPRHRNKGHGRALLEYLRGMTDGRVEWSVLDWNVPSIEFYEALGARPVGGWTRYRWFEYQSGDSPGQLP